MWTRMLIKGIALNVDLDQRLLGYDLYFPDSNCQRYLVTSYAV